MKILLAAVHSKYVHSSLALPYLASFAGNIPGIDIDVKEFTIHQSDGEILFKITKSSPDLVAFSCYIWNIDRIIGIAADLKRENKNILIILGGPEVSYDSVDRLNDSPFIDCIIKGEGEETFKKIITLLAGNKEAALSTEKMDGVTFRKSGMIIDTKQTARIKNLDSIPSPFTGGFMDMNKPLVYYESSRGCPFSCAFCISSVDAGVRFFSIERVKKDLQSIINSNASYIKFLDRTFNSPPERANDIWNHILENNISSRHHFEIAADLLTEENFELLREAGDGLFRFEIGVQSVSENALKSVGRKSDIVRVISNVKRLLNETEVVAHLDLVAGLPNDTFDSIMDSLESLLSVRPHHIQIVALKVLKGSPMVHIAEKEGYVYSDSPPYKISSTPWLSQDEIEEIEIIGRLMDLVYNSGRFKASIDIISGIMPLSVFFLRFARLWKKKGLTTMSLHDLFELFWELVLSFLDTTNLSYLCDSLVFDYCLTDYPDRKKLPAFFRVNDGGGLFLKKNDLKIIREELHVSSTTKVRAFRRNFKRDYRVDCRSGSGIYLLFVYLSSPGKRQDIRIMERGDC